jgi:quinol monooxygenase YgiN
MPTRCPRRRQAAGGGQDPTKSIGESIGQGFDTIPCPNRSANPFHGGVSVPYGFSATLRARPGLGDELLAALLANLATGKPATRPDCHAFLVSRSASDPELFTVSERWVSQRAHDDMASTEESRETASALEALIVAAPEFADFVPVGGRVSL